MQTVQDSVLVIVPARGGSKGVPGKNLRSIGGRSLVQRAVEVGHYVSDIVVVSSDDPAILEAARRCGAVARPRPSELATDEATTLDVVLSLLPDFPDREIVVVLQPTSPLRSPADVEGCLDRLTDGPSVTSVTPLEHPAEWIVELDAHDRLQLPSTQDQPTRRQLVVPRYRLNGAVYCARRDWLIAGNPLVGTGTIGVAMPPERSIDIDTTFDLILAGLLAEHSGQDLDDVE